MNNSFKFKELREKYPEFIYEDYKIEENEKEICIKYIFNILNLRQFVPIIKIPKKEFKIKDISTNKIRNMIFHIGLIELISYWKCTCSPKVIIKCGSLSVEQIEWFKKLYFYGLGELFFTNGIETNINDFMEIECLGDEIKVIEEKNNLEGYIVPIGGGKDSCVTLETLKLDRKRDFSLIINPKPVTLECAKMAGFENTNIIEVYRTIDKNLIDLNKEGFINGHTPFSAMLAFFSYFIAYILGKRYIALSNESSANESNVVRRKGKSSIF
ncbi:MAG: hypothetical protein HFJ54_04690 [Clostridia bacterium]|nr:hypothetical protein [Clostridia bacterium]